jgi:hypothetical protein
MSQRTMTIILDDDDYRAVQEAIARRQSMRVDGQAIIDPGESDTAGTYLAEICRGWLERIERD